MPPEVFYRNIKLERAEKKSRKRGMLLELTRFYSKFSLELDKTWVIVLRMMQVFCSRSDLVGSETIDSRASRVEKCTNYSNRFRLLSNRYHYVLLKLN